MLRAVEGKAQVADAAGRLLPAEKVDEAVGDVPLVEGILSAPSDGVEKVVVEVVRPELLEGFLVHLQGALRGPVAKIG